MTLCLALLCVLALAWSLGAFAAGRTGFVYVANSAGDGISRFRLDHDSGGLEQMADIPTGAPVSPLAVSPDRRFLYACLRAAQPSVAAFALDGNNGDAEPLTVVPAPAVLSYIRVDAGGRFLLGASYSGDLVCVLPIGPGGFLQEEPICILRPGRNPHCILLDHSNRFAYCPCLGSDHISQFLFDERGGSLVPNRPSMAAAGREAGPRHMALSPDNRFAYVLTELSGEVIAYAVDANAGTLSEKQRLSIMPPGSALPRGTYQPPLNSGGGGNSPEPVIWAADIRITPDGRFLYASERTTSRIACLTADPISGRLDFAGAYETEQQPRALAIDARGRHLMAAGEKSDSVSLYSLDRNTGALALLSKGRTGKNPNWIEMVDPA